MNSNPVKFLLLVAVFAFAACQKENIHPAMKAPNTGAVSDRSPGHITFGVTVYDGVNPSQIVQIDEATGNVLATFPATVEDAFGVVHNLDDLKGICRTSWGQFFLTTGSGNTPAVYNNSLLKVNVMLPGLPLGRCSFFNSTCPTGPVSDLEFNPVTQTFFGLQDNSNQILEISLDPASGNYTQYSAPATLIGILDRSLSGLSLVRDDYGTYLVGAATRPGYDGLPAQLFEIPPNGGVALWLTDLTPDADFAGGHCAIGFDLDLNHLAINRTTTNQNTFLGLSEINPWVPPMMPLTTATAPWGKQLLNFEDLTSSVY